ncbi:MAG: ubiquinone/menaquinone biosynthesis methyltransferase [Actinomycetota bacterium]
MRAMFDAIAPRYDLVNRIMTFGMDVGWRRRTVASLGLGQGALVLDLACGTGDLCRELQARGYRAVGFDLSLGMLRAATASVPLVQGDVLRLPLRSGCADGITCGFALRNVVDIGHLFEEMARVLRPGGRVGILEVATPDARLLRAGHHFYFHKVVPLVGGLLSDRDAYRYLPRSTAYLPDRATLIDKMHRAGLAGATSRLLAGGAAQLVTATRS